MKLQCLAVLLASYPDSTTALSKPPTTARFISIAIAALGADFDKLDRGAKVRFVEEEGEQGPQASTVVVTKVASDRR